MRITISCRSCGSFRSPCRGIARVATSLGKSKERDDVYKELIALQMNFRVLECVHDLTEVATGLDALAAQERWESASLRARTAGPTAWAWLDNRLRLAPEEIGHIEQREEGGAQGGERSAAGPAEGARTTRMGGDLQQEMQQRMNKERRPIAQERADPRRGRAGARGDSPAPAAQGESRAGARRRHAEAAGEAGRARQGGRRAEAKIRGARRRRAE